MITIDFTQEPMKSLLLAAFNEQSREFLREHAQADPQYTCEEVAELLGVDVSTVYGYVKLEATHQRYLPVVHCSDSPRGNRIRLSAVRAWQERNSDDLQQAKQEEPEKLMQISHRRAARRDRKAA